MYEHERYEHKGLTIRIVADDDPTNPLEDWDHGATVAINGSNRRYSWGGCESFVDIVEASGLDTSVAGWSDALKSFVKREYGATVVLRVFMYEHSGVAIRCEGPSGGNPFSCGWDSGLLGIVYDTPEGNAMTGVQPEHVEEALRGVVESFGQYVSGEVYGYIIEDAEGDELESLWGMFGDIDEYVKTEAESAADSLIAYRAKQSSSIDRMMHL